jgi:hypothetical protein
MHDTVQERASTDDHCLRPKLVAVAQHNAYRATFLNDQGINRSFE